MKLSKIANKKGLSNATIKINADGTAKARLFMTCSTGKTITRKYKSIEVDIEISLERNEGDDNFLYYYEDEYGFYITLCTPSKLVK